MKFYAGVGLFLVMVLCGLWFVAKVDIKQQQQVCGKWESEVVVVGRGYLCVKGGLIIDKSTGEIIGLGKLNDNQNP